MKLKIVVLVVVALFGVWFFSSSLCNGYWRGVCVNLNCVSGADDVK